jgi:hypothetical protein
MQMLQRFGYKQESLVQRSLPPQERLALGWHCPMGEDTIFFTAKSESGVTTNRKYSNRIVHHIYPEPVSVVFVYNSHNRNNRYYACSEFGAPPPHVGCYTSDSNNAFDGKTEKPSLNADMCW